MTSNDSLDTRTGWRPRLYEIVFEHETPTGKWFDIALLWAILLSVLAVILESVGEIRAAFGGPLRTLEWGFTLLFTVEYVLRLIVIDKPARYARSFFGIVDLLAILPTYLSLVMVGTQTLIVIRALRLLRVFRVLKLAHFIGAEQMLGAALRASARKITVFLGAVMTLVLIIGSMMYLIEGEPHGFDSIPRGMYWAIVTLTTVGFGDITPQTLAGQLLASVVMIMGYAIIAVPTGIVTVELSRSKAGMEAAGAAPSPADRAARERRLETAPIAAVFDALGAGSGDPLDKDPDPVTGRICPACGYTGHDDDARFCKRCGTHL